MYSYRGESLQYGHLKANKRSKRFFCCEEKAYVTLFCSWCCFFFFKYVCSAGAWWVLQRVSLVNDLSSQAFIEHEIFVGSGTGHNPQVELAVSKIMVFSAITFPRHVVKLCFAKGLGVSECVRSAVRVSGLCSEL